MKIAYPNADEGKVIINNETAATFNSIATLKMIFIITIFELGIFVRLYPTFKGVHFFTNQDVKLPWSTCTKLTVLHKRSNMRIISRIE